MSHTRAGTGRPDGKRAFQGGTCHLLLKKVRQSMARAYLLLQWATLSSPDGMPDLSQLRHAVKTIGKPLDRYATVIIKSTVPPAGTKLVQEWISPSPHC